VIAGTNTRHYHWSFLILFFNTIESRGLAQHEILELFCAMEEETQKLLREALQDETGRANQRTSRFYDGDDRPPRSCLSAVQVSVRFQAGMTNSVDDYEL
jgi:hypothetical protein